MEKKENTESLLKEEEKEFLPLEEKIANELFKSNTSITDLKKFSRKLIKSKATNKADFCKEIAHTMCDKEKFFEYYNKFSETGKYFLDKLVFSPFAMKSQIMRILKPENNHSWFYYYRDVIDQIPMIFATVLVDGEMCVLFPNTKELLKTYLAPENNVKSEISVEELSKTNGYFSEEDGLAFFINLSHIMQVLEDADFFERDIGTPIPKTILTKIEKIVPLSKFTQNTDFTNYETKIRIDDDDYFDRENEDFSYSNKIKNKLENSRISLALSFISRAVSKMKEKKSDRKELAQIYSNPQILLRKIVEKFFEGDDVSYDKKFIYPCITPSDFYYAENFESYRKYSYSDILKVIQKALPFVPTRFSDYIETLANSGLPAFVPFNSVAQMQYFYDDSPCSSSPYLMKGKMNIYDKLKYDTLVFTPSCTNLFLAFASLGLFEITWEIPCEPPQDNSEIVAWKNNLNWYPFGRIGYIRVTELGKYVFGITNEFKVAGLKTYAPPKLDDKFLIVHIEDGDKAMQIFLDPFCTSISKTLFKVDVSRLKKCCNTKNDVNNIFDTLGARAKGSLPQIWEDLRDEILKKFITLQCETEWVVISLEGINAAAVREIEKLSRRGVCVKMEGKRVALEKSKLPHFKHRLEDAGYKVN